MRTPKRSSLSLNEHDNFNVDESITTDSSNRNFETELLVSSELKVELDSLKVPNLSPRSKYSEEKANRSDSESPFLLQVTVKDKYSSVGKKKNFILSPQFRVFVSHFLSSWGDRMWMFAGGLFLIEITPGSLRLIAIYEAALSLTVIFFGSTIGRWIDRTSRLSAAQSSLILQNSMVCACTLLLCMMTIYKTTFYESLHGWGGVLGQVGVVFLSCLAQIGTLGSKFVIEKDWIIIISEQSDTQLSTMNSVLRTVDLSTKILAPVLVGFIMTSAGMVIGGIVIGVWNLVSLCVEYGLLHKLYYDVASLQKPKQGKMQNDLEGENTSKGIKEKVKDAAFVWKSYFKHNVRDAGLGLALLYMTVLSLDNFSRAYVHENGVSKEILGVLTGVASISGILGSIAYPFLRKKLGPLKTGVFGFTYQVTCLLFCLASVFAPGSPFNPHALFSCNNSTFIGDHQETSSIDFNNSLPLQYNNFTTESYNKSLYEYNATEKFYEPLNDTQTLVTEPSQGIIYTSVILLLFGIVTSRFGLWLADLTVTQILQEEVAENERCGINGVQDSLNQFFGLVRAILIIVMPTMATFGYLIILSIAFVFLATVLFAVYAKKKSKNNNPVSQPNCKSCKNLS